MQFGKKGLALLQECLAVVVLVLLLLFITELEVDLDGLVQVLVADFGR